MSNMQINRQRAPLGDALEMETWRSEDVSSFQFCTSVSFLPLPCLSGP